MRIKYIWRNCDFKNLGHEVDPINAFWVEATYEEAEKEIFPILSAEHIAKSKELAEKRSTIAADLGEPPRPYCYLVSQDLSAIYPMHVTYPFDNLWNAYSPFEDYPETTIEMLEELNNLAIPMKDVV